MNYLKLVFFFTFITFAQPHFASVHNLVPNHAQTKKITQNNVLKHKKTAHKIQKNQEIRPEQIQKNPKNKWRIFTILMVPSLALTVIAAALPYSVALILFYIAGVLFIAALLALLLMSIPPSKKKKKTTTENTPPVEKIQ